MCMMIMMITIILLMIMIKDESKVLHPQVPFLLLATCLGVSAVSVSPAPDTTRCSQFAPTGVHTTSLHNTGSSQGLLNES